MDVIRIARGIRALRRRRGWRQIDLAAAAVVSRGTVARIELGQVDRITGRTLERVVAALGARLLMRVEWNGESLDRLLDSAHASLVDQVVRNLRSAGWVIETEVSFNLNGERGSIDVLAWHPGSTCLLVVEVKSVIPDIQAMLVALDRKGRLAPVIARDRGWEVATAGRLLVVREDRTSRRRVDAHAAIFEASLPNRARAVRGWIARPTSTQPLRGLWFLSDARHADTRHRVGRVRRGPERPAERARGR